MVMKIYHKLEIMKWPTTFVFTTTTENIIYTMKIIAETKLNMQPKQQWYRKLIGNSESIIGVLDHQKWCAITFWKD